jgi:hypothetical protein
VATTNSITICPSVGRLAYGRSNSLPANRCGYSLSYERYSVTRQLSSPLEGTFGKRRKEGKTSTSDIMLTYPGDLNTRIGLGLAVR